MYLQKFYKRVLEEVIDDQNPLLEYSDMGLITSDEKFGIDATNYFNYLSGHMVKPEYHHLIVSPSDIRDEYVELVDKEISYHQQFGDGHI
jgi:polyphosphate kinase